MGISVGLGLRREITEALLHLENQKPAFLEVAPENWMEIGGYWGNLFHQISEKFELTAHGLSLSIGAKDELNIPFLKRLKSFLDEYSISLYSEHLAFSTMNNAHLYESLPVAFTDESVKHISTRVKQVQEILERKVILENVVYYTLIDQELSELDFYNAVASEADCEILLDFNNVFVNGKNFNYDPYEFISKIDTSKVSYLHVGGHQEQNDGLLLDAHNNPIKQEVLDLIRKTKHNFNADKLLFERDANLDDLNELLAEIKRIEKSLE
ncbi:MAG: DUF692 domain-containing protein [Crocinitomicaceae bacterium]|nr:DUF692 domain-containing protein [Crocinitomicaceae bacterium]